MKTEIEERNHRLDNLKSKLNVWKQEKHELEIKISECEMQIKHNQDTVAKLNKSK